ncbi:MarR family winged helix-turn-helix transcriptional regulator [Oscillochloris sp. ZM17-4]|uniref:MarR family winged helix-turn-helix transcriptional regulator n=1 Tax=Oscillochloris sp. ZM17-4 TaxID=2866714 RepID=UPI0021040E75|nr:MarR family transcriptional regulator [Oscillochloris sp. ZM17-4]
MIHDIYVMLDDGDRHLLRAFDLSTSQYAALRLLDEAEGLRLTDIGERLLLDKSTVTRMIDRLERLDLVRRLPDPLDRRVLRVVLTPHGSSVRDASSATYIRSLVRRMHTLTDDEQRQLYALLDKLYVGLRSDLIP